MKRTFWLLFCSIWAVVGAWAQPERIKCLDDQIFHAGVPFYFVGANFWYAPLLASDGVVGDRGRLDAELRELKANGVRVVRVQLALNQVESVTDSIFTEMDYFLSELNKHQMVAVVCLLRSWNENGAFNWSSLLNNKKEKAAIQSRIAQLLSRTNALTDVPYKKDTAIMAWELANRLECPSVQEKEPFAQFVHEMVAKIKETDPHHLVATGSTGFWGCAHDWSLFEQIHADGDVDYISVHLLPEEWRWADRTRLFEDLPNAYQNASGFLNQHKRIAHKLGKPFVIESFGYPRDQYMLQEGTPTQSRDGFYSFLFGQILSSFMSNGLLAGGFFDGWSGAGRPEHELWEPGDDLLSEPLCESQGRYSVLNTDSFTLRLLQDYSRQLKP